MKMDVRYFSVVFFVLCLLYTTKAANTYYNIGGMLSNAEIKTEFLKKIDEVNSNPASFGLSDGRLNASVSLLNADPLNAMKDICNQLINNSVYIVITDRAINTTRDPFIVSYACAFYNIPVIGISARDSEFSDKEKHSFFLRTVPSLSDQARPLVQLVRYFKWGQVILITSNDHNHRKMFIKFTSLAYDYSITVEYPIIFASGSKNLTSYLTDVSKKRSKVIIFAASSSDAAVLYRDATALGLTTSGYSWIVTEEAASGIALDTAPQGLITVRLKQGTDYKSHINDAVMIAAKTMGRFDTNTSGLTKPPSSCNEKPGLWQSGKMLYKSMVNKTYSGGLTGDIKIDKIGDRINAAYDVLNLKNESGAKYLTDVGQFDANGNISVKQTQIRWPGNRTEVPKGVYVSNHLRIVTVESHPFLTVHETVGKDCANIKEIGEDNKLIKFVRCTGPSSFKSGNEHCCKGFCIDLLLKLANKTGFTYDLHLSGDRRFGSLTKNNGSDVKRWNGAVGEIIDGKADLIVASVTINNERAQYIEFSKPFKYQGISILVKNKLVESSLGSFLRPFKTELWLLVLLSVHIVAFILYLLDRFSPFGRYQRARANKQEDPLDLPSAMWFSWGVLLNSGIGEVTPRSFSARVLGMVWAAFAMIIVASYTANLAAFLVLERPKPVVSGIDDPNLRNPSSNFPYCTVKGSSVEGYFKRQVELSNMYTFMEKYNVKTEKEGIESVKNGSIKAFIWDSPVLFYQTSSSKDCKLSTAGELFGRSGYGIGMPKGSPWSSPISLAILHFHESGVMEQLETRWIAFGKCPKTSSSPTTLGLNHMLGVFIMVAVGIGAGIIIVILEVIYYRRKGMRKEEREIAAKYCDHWKATTEESKKKKFSVAFSGVNGYELNGSKSTQNNPSYEPDILHHK